MVVSRNVRCCVPRRECRRDGFVNLPKRQMKNHSKLSAALTSSGSYVIVFIGDRYTVPSMVTELCPSNSNDWFLFTLNLTEQRVLK